VGIKGEENNMKRSSLWAVLWRAENRLNGKTEHLVNDFACLPVIFTTRQQARDYAKMRYGYIKDRKDLREEPHGWKRPIPVKVEVRIVSGRSASQGRRIKRRDT
jgi:hypothetical protein